MANQEEGQLSGWEWPVDFEMPSVREIELELALGNDCWQSLLSPDRPWRESRGADASREPGRNAP
jgi:hypothetical protein